MAASCPAVALHVHVHVWLSDWWCHGTHTNLCDTLTPHSQALSPGGTDCTDYRHKVCDKTDVCKKVGGNWHTVEHGIKAPARPIGVKSKHGRSTVKLSAATPSPRRVHHGWGVASVQSVSQDTRQPVQGHWPSLEPSATAWQAVVPVKQNACRSNKSYQIATAPCSGWAYHWSTTVMFTLLCGQWELLP